MMQFSETKPPPLFGTVHLVAQRLPGLSGHALIVLSEHDVLRIIAEPSPEQIHASNIGGVILDANPHRDGLARFQRQIIETDFGDLDAIHKAAAVSYFPDLEKPVL